MLLEKMQQYWMSILKNKKIFTRNYYKCKILTVILIILMVFTGCRQERITEKVQKKETVESAMYAEAKETAQIFQNIYIQEKSELNTLKTKRKIINCLKMQGYVAVDRDNQIDMVNSEKVEKFCKAAEKEKQAAVDIIVVFDEGEIIQYHLESMNGKIIIHRPNIMMNMKRMRGNIRKKDICLLKSTVHRDLMEHRVKLDSECSH